MDAKQEVERTLAMIALLRQQHGVENHPDAMAPLLYVGIAKAEHLDAIFTEISKIFGPPYKPSGSIAFWLNLFNPFVRAIGGSKYDQTLFRKDLAPGLSLFCALWPWGSDPSRTSVRIGLYCESETDMTAWQASHGHRFS